MSLTYRQRLVAVGALACVVVVALRLSDGRSLLDALAPLGIVAVVGLAFYWVNEGKR